MYVNLLRLEHGKQVVKAVIRVAPDGQLAITGKLPPATMELLEFEYGVAKERGEDFLKRLPRVISGTYSRAEYVEE